jgi:hypothetical protein
MFPPFPMNKTPVNGEFPQRPGLAAKRNRLSSMLISYYIRKRNTKSERRRARRFDLAPLAPGINAVTFRSGFRLDRNSLIVARRGRMGGPYGKFRIIRNW